MRSSRRNSGRREDHGAVAVIVAIVLAFAMMPALALGTGSYVRSTTGTELQRASDSGALAGAAEIPLGNVTFVTNYLNKAANGSLTGPLSAFGLTDTTVDPLTDACNAAKLDAQNTNNLAHSYASMSSLTCTPKYVANDSAISQLVSCVSNLDPVGLSGFTLTLVNALLGSLGLAKLDASLGSLLPALLDPGVEVDMSWHVTAPFDSVFASNGHDQASTSIARRRFKNVLVIPSVSLPVAGGSLTIDANAATSAALTIVFQTLTSLENLLGGTTFRTLLPGVSSCISALQNLQGDVSDLLDPPSSGPDLTSLLDDAASSKQPVLALVVGTGIPFLDFVPVCIPNATNVYSAVVASASNLGCLTDAPGVFRASLRNS